MMFLLISSDINRPWESYFLLSFPPYHIFPLDIAHSNEYTMSIFSLLKVD